MHLVQINEGRSLSAEDVTQVDPLRPTRYYRSPPLRTHTDTHTPSLHRFCINDDTIKTKYNVYCAPCLFPLLILKPKPQLSEEGFNSSYVVLSWKVGGGVAGDTSSSCILTTKQKRASNLCSIFYCGRLNRTAIPRRQAACLSSAGAPSLGLTHTHKVTEVLQGHMSRNIYKCIF